MGGWGEKDTGIPGEIATAGRRDGERLPPHYSTAGQTSPLRGRADPQGTQHITHRAGNFSLIPSASKVSSEVEKDYTIAIKMGKLSHGTGQGFVWHPQLVRSRAWPEAKVAFLPGFFSEGVRGAGSGPQPCHGPRFDLEDTRKEVHGTPRKGRMFHLGVRGR